MEVPLEGGKTLKALGAFPTWAITLAIVSLMPSHPWHKRSFSLREWHARQTPLCRTLDVLFYLTIVCFILTLVLVFRSLRTNPVG